MNKSLRKRFIPKDYYRLPVLPKKNVDPKTWRIRPLEKGNSVRILEGKEFGSSQYRIYTYLFPVEEFTLGSARLWLKEKGIQEYRMHELRTSLNDLVFKALKTIHERPI